MMVNEDIVLGKICPYCKSTPIFVDSSVVYKKSYGFIYLCPTCKAYVGANKETNEPLGRLSNEILRYWKKQAHEVFDVIAKTDLINKVWDEFIPKVSNRQKAYLWLSIQMNIDPKYCHIGMFNVEQCKQVIEISKKAIKLCTQ